MKTYENTTDQEAHDDQSYIGMVLGCIARCLPTEKGRI